MDFKKGEILAFDKPYEWTSFGLVAKVRYLLCKRLGVKKLKVGHAGTLDPLLPESSWSAPVRNETDRGTSCSYEEYVATLRLGATTPSFDLEKPVDAEYPTEHITREMVEETLNRFVGMIEQVPPVFSACKVNGSRAYDLARKGEEVELKAKTLVIDELELLRCELPEIVIRVVCSKGTYIRALARDIGVALKSGAHLTALRRTRIGAVRVEDCLKLDDFAEWLNRQTIEITEDN